MQGKNKNPCALPSLERGHIHGTKEPQFLLTKFHV